MKIRDFEKLIQESISDKIKSEIVKESSEKYLVKTEDGVPLESFDKKEEADKFKSDHEKKNPKQKLLVDKFGSYDDMMEELDEMNDKLEQKEISNMKNEMSKDSNYMKTESVKKLAILASKTRKSAANKLINLTETIKKGKVNLNDVISILNEHKLYDLKKKITLKEDMFEQNMNNSDDELFNFDDYKDMTDDDDINLGDDDIDDIDDIDEPSYIKKPMRKSEFMDNEPDEYDDIRSSDFLDYNSEEDDDDIMFDDLKEIDMDEELYELNLDDEMDNPKKKSTKISHDYSWEDDFELARDLDDQFADYDRYDPHPDDVDDNSHGMPWGWKYTDGGRIEDLDEMTEMEPDFSMEEMMSMDGDMYEGKGMCSECGSMLNEEGMCSECMKEGSYMNESKKRKLVLKESELINLVKKMVLESVPGLSITQKNRKKSGAESNSHMKDVESKMKKTRKFDGNDNPSFPKQIGKGEKVARQNTSEEDKIMSTYRGGGLEDLKYDTQPSKSFNERIKKALKGDSTMGNSQDSPNVMKSDTGENIMKKAQMKKDTLEKDTNVSWGHAWKEPEKVKIVKESKNKESSQLKKEMNRMKDIASYNKKTQ